MTLLTTPSPDIISQYSELSEEKIQLEKRITERADEPFETLYRRCIYR
jgi:signal transduction protein with GAF and PtsI domain